MAVLYVLGLLHLSLFGFRNHLDQGSLMPTKSTAPAIVTKKVSHRFFMELLEEPIYEFRLWRTREHDRLSSASSRSQGDGTARKKVVDMIMADLQYLPWVLIVLGVLYLIQEGRSSHKLAQVGATCKSAFDGALNWINRWGVVVGAPSQEERLPIHQTHCQRMMQEEEEEEEEKIEEVKEEEEGSHDHRLHQHEHDHDHEHDHKHHQETSSCPMAILYETDDEDEQPPGQLSPLRQSQEPEVHQQEPDHNEGGEGVVAEAGPVEGNNPDPGAQEPQPQEPNDAQAVRTFQQPPPPQTEPQQPSSSSTQRHEPDVQPQSLHPPSPSSPIPQLQRPESMPLSPQSSSPQQPSQPSSPSPQEEPQEPEQDGQSAPINDRAEEIVLWRVQQSDSQAKAPLRWSRNDFYAWKYILAEPQLRPTDLLLGVDSVYLPVPRHMPEYVLHRLMSVGFMVWVVRRKDLAGVVAREKNKLENDVLGMTLRHADRRQRAKDIHLTITTLEGIMAAC